MEQLSRLLAETRPFQDALYRSRVRFNRSHLAAAPALSGELSGKIRTFHCRETLIGSDAQLAHGFRQLAMRNGVRELERGKDFEVLTPLTVRDFGAAVALMRDTLKRRGIDKFSIAGPAGTEVEFPVDQLTAESRQTTAKLVVNEPRLEVHFSIYRNVVSLLDYVQIAVTLPGLKVDRHKSQPGLFFLTAV